MKSRIYLLVGALAVLFSSCDDGVGLFPSKKKIRNDIRHTWELVPVTLPKHEGEGEVWTFTNKDSILITRSTFSPDSNKIIAINDRGVYFISTDWNSAFVHISGLTFDEINLKLNTKWDIVQVDDVLYIAAKPDNSGLMQREFLKR